MRQRRMVARASRALLGFEWSFLCNDPALVDCVTSLYAGCADIVQSPARCVFILRRHTDESVSSTGTIVPRSVEPLRPWRSRNSCGKSTAASSRKQGNRLILHAAAAKKEGRIVLIAGPEGSGKSTLVAALVCSGLRYVTDETVAIDLTDATITPYPKRISLDEHSIGFLRNLFPAIPAALVAGQGERLAPAQAIRCGAVAETEGSARLLMVLSDPRPGHPTLARPIPRAETVIVLAEQAFNFGDLGPGRLDVVADIARACDCSGSKSVTSTRPVAL
jgi:hypothetical protein